VTLADGKIFPDFPHLPWAFSFENKETVNEETVKERNLTKS
jgi:hypothetical protein